MAEYIFFEKSLKVFKILHIWCLYKKRTNTKFDSICKSWAIICCGNLMVILSLLDVIETIQMDQVDAKFTKLLFMCVALVVNQKIIIVTYTEKNIMDCISQLQTITSKFENKTDFDKAHRLYNKIFFIGTWAMNVSVFFFMVAPAVFLQKRKLFFQPKIPFLNIQESPMFELMFIHQTLSAFILTNITLAYDLIYCGMLCISVAAHKSISREIRETDEVIQNHQKSEAKLKNIIEKIIEISGFTEKMSDIFAMTTLVHIVYICGTMALGLNVMSRLPFNDLTCFSMFLATLLSTFLLWIYCYFGQILLDQRRMLRTELYFIRWYKASRNLKTMVLVSMSVLQRDSFVYAGKIIPLSMETFGQVLMKAYTFFTFMNDVRHK